ncbi:hypothetical protein BGZ67_005587 [Mortierella alpina]|nr:hypothetical protein BGZ67_005587 [Mortierella alpina]
MSDNRSDGIMSMCDSQSAKNDAVGDDFSHPSVPVGTANAQVETLATVIDTSSLHSLLKYQACDKPALMPLNVHPSLVQETDAIDTSSIALCAVQVETSDEIKATIFKDAINKASESIPTTDRSSSLDLEGDSSSIVTVQRSHRGERYYSKVFPEYRRNISLDFHAHINMFLCFSFCATPLTRTTSTGSVASSVSTLRPSSPEDKEVARDESAKVPTDYWHFAFGDAPASLELFTDRPHQESHSFAKAEHAFHIDTPLKQLLISLSVEHSLSFATAILVGWSIVLSRLSGQEDILMGIVSANRDIIPVRIDLAGEPNTQQLLDRVRGILPIAGANPGPLGKSNTRPLPSFSKRSFPSVQATFYAHDDEASDITLESAPASFDIELHLHDAGEDAFASIHYPASLFNSDTIERHAGYLVAVLMNMVINGSQSVATIDIISPAEKTLVLKTWNDSSSDYPADRCVQHLFEEQVEKSPDAIAIVQEDQSFTYLELDALADRIAHKLVYAGIKQGDFVAILLPRSVELVAAQLAVLKVGAAYVPMDPKAPVDRQVFIVNDSTSRLLITDIQVEVATALNLPVLRIGMLRIRRPHNHFS